jgi:hypothetical protein
MNNIKANWLLMMNRIKTTYMKKIWITIITMILSGGIQNIFKFFKSLQLDNLWFILHEILPIGGWAFINQFKNNNNN